MEERVRLWILGYRQESGGGIPLVLVAMLFAWPVIPLMSTQRYSSFQTLHPSRSTEAYRTLPSPPREGIFCLQFPYAAFLAAAALSRS